MKLKDFITAKSATGSRKKTNKIQKVSERASVVQRFYGCEEKFTAIMQQEVLTR
jgi:hypothetical protein